MQDPIHSEYRWALVTQLCGFPFFIPKNCWPDAEEDAPKIQTWRTRKLAREAQKTCSHEDTKVVKVSMLLNTAKCI